MAKVQILQTQQIINELLKIKSPNFEDGVAGVEVENEKHYLYCYDWFDGKTFEYTLAEKIGNEYIPIPLSTNEINFLKNLLWEITVEAQESENEPEPESTWIHPELIMNPHFSLLNF